VSCGIIVGSRMSFSFYVRTAENGLPTLDQLLEGLEPDVGVVEDVPRDELLAGTRHVYRAGLSTRGVCLRVGPEGDLEVLLGSCASREDYALAVDLVIRAAALTGSAAEAEDSEQELEPGQVQALYRERWIEEQVHAACDAVVHVTEESGRVQMSGPNRTFHLGPRLLADLRRAGPEDTLWERLIGAMRRVQWPSNRWYAATSMTVKSRTSKTTSTIAVWAPDVAYLFPPVDHLVLTASDGGNDSIAVPYPVAPTIAPDRCRWLDEAHLLVEKTAVDEWDELRARAIPYREEMPPR
jgi:hypothetical protein